MELFWAIFWIMILIVPALWLAGILWSIAFYAIMFVFAGVITSVQWLYEKATGK